MSPTFSDFFTRSHVMQYLQQEAIAMTDGLQLRTKNRLIIDLESDVADRHADWKQLRSIFDVDSL
jgi:hypothetical protein